MTTAAKKPRIRRSQVEEPTSEIEVRVVEPNDDTSEDVTVRLIDDTPRAVEAPPLPEDVLHVGPSAAPEFVPPPADAESTEADDERWFRPVPYLASAVTHAALVLILALLTFGPEVTKRSVTLGVIEKAEPFDDTELVDDDTFEMPREIVASSHSATEDRFEVDDQLDVAPPSIDSSDNADSPLHLFPTGDDKWAPVPNALGPGGNEGGKGSNGDRSGTRSGKGASGRDGAPSYAVRKGSFAAWTVPKDPRPLRPYKIIIQVTLPKDIEEYTKNDLRGYVTGTDGYRQRIPQKEAKIPTRAELEEMIESGMVRLGNGGNSGDRMARAGKASSAERSKLKSLLRMGRLKMSKPAGGTFEYRNGRARLSVTVPGARNRVRDVIEIGSKILDEEQVLEIEF
ncbi:MAG: hypothetical protein MI757_12110 [Pirellulales bacterium]|nr:hypothetical protein [Pirellulales bacterium]